MSVYLSKAGMWFRCLFVYCCVCALWRPAGVPTPAQDPIKDCEKIMERNQNLEKIHALLEKSEHLGDILCLLSTLETKHF
jgi:hypothetical protein